MKEDKQKIFQHSYNDAAHFEIQPNLMIWYLIVNKTYFNLMHIWEKTVLNDHLAMNDCRSTSSFFFPSFFLFIIHDFPQTCYPNFQRPNKYQLFIKYKSQYNVTRHSWTIFLNQFMYFHYDRLESNTCKQNTTTTFFNQNINGATSKCKMDETWGVNIKKLKFKVKIKQL